MTAIVIALGMATALATGLTVQRLRRRRERDARQRHRREALEARWHAKATDAKDRGRTA